MTKHLERDRMVLCGKLRISVEQLLELIEEFRKAADSGMFICQD